MITSFRKKIILSASAVVLLVVVIIILQIDKARTESPSSPQSLANQNGSSTDYVMDIDTHLSVLSDQRQPVKTKATTAAKTKNYPITAACSLHLEVVPDRSSVANGGAVHYSYALTNSSRSVCPNASVSAYYSNNEKYTYSDPKPTASTYYWVIGDMKPGQVNRISVNTEHVPDGDASISNEVCASADDAADSCSDNTIAVGSSGSTAGSTAAGGSGASSGTSGASILSPVKDAIKSVVSQTSSIASHVRYALAGHDYGTWVWKSPYAMKWDQSKSLIDAASASGFNVIYVTVDDYLNIQSMPAGSAKETARKGYASSIQQFIAYANGKGISVDAECGWRDWAEKDKRGKQHDIIDLVSAYNNSHKDKFRKIQFDVEPYLLPEYSKDKGSVLSDFVDFVNDAVSRNPSVDGIEIVIPHFYDSKQQWTPKVSADGQSGYPFTLLLNALDRKPGNAIIIMAYRNNAEGDDGSVAISKAEVDEAGNGNHSTKIIVAQETGDVQPGYVTFYGRSKSDLLSQINMINQSFGNSPAFGGVAVHYLDTYLELKDKD